LSFFAELKRRNVFRVGIAYGVAAWVLLQVVDLVLDNVEAPGWVMDVFMLVVVLGFIVALVIAWAYELTPEGIKRESEVDREESVTLHTAKKLDVITLGAIVLLVIFMLVDRFVLQRPGSEPAQAIENTVQTSPDTAEADEVSSEPAIESKSIAVLPLANRSINEEDAFFAEGIHDEILTRLSRIADLKVISRTSVMSYSNTTKKMAEIGQELGVAHLLEGGVQRAGDRVRINVQLIEAATDKHLWAEVYDRDLTADNLFNIQSEITRAISDALQAVLTGEEQLALDNKPTENVEAYAYYLRAKALAAGYGRGEDLIRDSISIYQAAIELDPGFAAAWAALATDWTELHWTSAGTGGERDKAEAAFAKAKDLAPDSADTHIAEGYLHYWGYLDYPPALDAFRRALDKKPGSVLALRGLAYTQRRSGDIDQSIAMFRRAIELDPNDPGMPADLGYTLLRRGKMSEAEMMFRRAINQDPDNSWNRWAATGYYLALSDPQGAIDSFGAITKDLPRNYYDGLHQIARILKDEALLKQIMDAWQGREAVEGASRIAHGLWLHSRGNLEGHLETLRSVERPLLEAADSSPDPDVQLGSLLVLYGLLGEREKLNLTMQRYQSELRPDAMRIVEDFSPAVAWTLAGEKHRALDIADEMVERFGIWEFSTFVLSPVFNSLRGEPRYKELALRYDRWLETVQ
jgi:TolB-like protein/Tfp pilus assembly protein PilF